MRSVRIRAFVSACGLALVAIAAPRNAAADEVWVSPTYQQDLGGLGVGSNTIWPATAAGAVRFAWAIPNDLQTLQAAKVVLIPHGPGGAATLNVVVCQAQSGSLALSGCAALSSQAFNGVTNQLLEVDLSTAIAPKIGVPGANYLAVLAYTSPSAATDHIVGLRFAYASTAVSLGSSNVFTAAQTVNVAAGAAAVVGHNVAGTHGVEGISDSGDAGVFGKSNATGGASYGVYGDASANLGTGTGVFGIGTSYGLFGQSTRTSSTGVFGRSAGVAGQTYGVYGEALATTAGLGFGVFGTGNGFGVYGNNESTAAAAAGVWGESRMSIGAVYGVGGLVNSTTVGAAAVFGTANGASGTTFGVRGVNASNSTDAAGVRGDANGASGVTAGGYFRSASSNGTGVLGWAPSATGATYGLRGESDSNAGNGVFGWAPATAGGSAHTYGVKGQSEMPGAGIGVAGIATDGGKSVATVPLNNPVGVLGAVSDSSPNGYGVVSIGNVKVFGGIQTTDYVVADTFYANDAITIAPAYTQGFLPSCGSPGTHENEGKIVQTHGGAGDDGHMFVCRQKSDNSWEWKQVF